MNVLIIGCGNVGSRLAILLANEGHDVSIVDSDPTNFRRIPDDLRVMTFSGFECDRELLQSAGIEVCDVVLAVTHDDNINILAAQMAVKIFNTKKTKRAIARIYDPEREEAFSGQGFQTVCPTRLAVESVYSAAMEANVIHRTLHFGVSTLSFEVENAEAQDVGKTLKDFADELAFDGIQLFGVMHPSGDMTMVVERPERLIGPGDRVITAHKVD